MAAHGCAILWALVSVIALHAWSSLASRGSILLGEEVLIGWRGETHNAELLYDPLHTHNVTDLPQQLPLPASNSWVELISWNPRVFVWHNFITDAEARHLIQLAVPQMKRSTVVGQGGKSVEDSYRTSYGTFLRRYQDAVVERLENKVAAFTRIPVEHQEDTQILRYGIGQYYKVHSDTLVDDDAGVRVCTMLIYLNEPEEGGETAFPNSQWVHPSLADTYGKHFSDCAKGHVAFKPKRGDALLFWSVGPDGKTEDYHASHTGCPVISGAKWTATKWIHAKPFRPYELQQAIKSRGVQTSHNDPGICEDLSTSCAEWAKQGWCTSNRDFMVVEIATQGQCRLTCGECTVCAPGDQECYNENRRRIGYLVHNPAEIK